MEQLHVVASIRPADITTIGNRSGSRSAADWPKDLKGNKV